MANYKFLKKGTFESLDKYEKKVNEFSQKGWKVVNMGLHGADLVILFEKER